MEDQEGVISRFGDLFATLLITKKLQVVIIADTGLLPFSSLEGDLLEEHVPGHAEGDLDIDTGVSETGLQETVVLGLGIDPLVEVLSVDLEAQAEVDISHDGHKDGVEVAFKCVTVTTTSLDDFIEVLDEGDGVGVLLASGDLELAVITDLKVNDFVVNEHDDGETVAEVSLLDALGLLAGLEVDAAKVALILEGNDTSHGDGDVGIGGSIALLATATLGDDLVVGDGELFKERGNIKA